MVRVGKKLSWQVKLLAVKQEVRWAVKWEALHLQAAELARVDLLQISQAVQQLLKEALLHLKKVHQLNHHLLK
jgi:hypothetical protein